MDLFNILKHNYILMFALAVFSLFLSKPNYVSGLFTILLVVYGSYGLHYFSHKNVPILNIFTKTHTNYHHLEKKNMFIDVILETLVNLFIYGMLLFYIILYYFFPKQKIISGKVVLMYALFYTSIHIINYTIFESSIHKKHHLELDNNNRICNLGPDFMDKLFSTHCDMEYENTNKYTINLLIIFMILLYI